jgi:hypothetical protein
MAINRIKAQDLQIGEYLSDIQYYRIIKIDEESVSVTNQRGFESYIDKEIVAEGMYSASQYETEKLVTRTEICEQLEQAGNHIFTVNFYKQVKTKDIEEKLLKVIQSHKSNSFSEVEIIKTLKKASKTLLEGEERTLIGYLSKVEPKVGRSTVIDLELSRDKYRIRQVDHRTINWLVLKNIKYIVK